MPSQLLGDGGHGRERVLIGHARRTENAHDASSTTIDLIRRNHDRAVAQLVESVLRADAHGCADIEELADERDNDDLVLEHLEQAGGTLRRGECFALGGETTDAPDVE